MTLECRTRKHKTPRSDVTIRLGFLKDSIEAEIETTIPKATWSDWCNRSKISIAGPATRTRLIEVEQAAKLWTFAGLYQYKLRDYNGPAYSNLYPQCLSRMEAFFNV